MPLPTTLIRITPPTLRSGYCWPAEAQTFINDVFGAVQATFITSMGNSFFNYGDTQPDPANEVYPWLKTDGNWYVYVSGYWIQRHKHQQSDGAVQMIKGTLADVWAFDGGDGTDPAAFTPTANTGAMWEVDPDFNAKFPVGVGTFVNAGGIASGSSTTTLGITGEDQHVLLVAELPKHTHDVAKDQSDSTSGGDMHLVNLSDPAGAVVASSITGSDVAHNNLPPMIGVYFCKRTARQNYTA